VKRSQFVVGRPNKDGLRGVFQKGTNRRVGYLCTPDGRNGGYRWKFCWMDNWASGTYPTIHEAVSALGERMWTQSSARFQVIGYRDGK
jgi:hypothetical protein